MVKAMQYAATHEAAEMIQLITEYRVADLMTVDPVVVRSDATVDEAEQLMKTYRVTGLPVVDEDGRLVGVISQTDLVWGPGLHVSALLRAKPSSIRVGELMTSPALTCSMATSIIDAAQTMIANRVHRLVATDDHERPIGVLSATDYVALVADIL